MLLLPFESPLVEAKLVKRYKRFFVDSILENGEEVTAHCPNTGSMKSCFNEGDKIYLLKSTSTTRKLAYTWELVKKQEGYIGINTARPNKLVKLAIEKQLVSELQNYHTIKSEVKISEKSRIDLVLFDDLKGECFIEIKNTTYLSPPFVMFPDAVTERGLKHLEELQELVQKGHRAVTFYLVNRPDGQAFKPADEIDPNYGKALRKAMKQGVEVLAYRCLHTLEGSFLGEKVSLEI